MKASMNESANVSNTLKMLIYDIMLALDMKCITRCLDENTILLEILDSKNSIVFSSTFDVENTLKTPKISFFRKLVCRKIKCDFQIQLISKVLDIRSIILNSLGARLKGKVRFLVRVDDFPRWDVNSELFKDFHEIFSNYEIPYLLGVTPCICKKPTDPRCSETRTLSFDERKFLKKIISDGVEVALHGYTHRTTRTRKPIEFNGLNLKEMRSIIELGFKELGYTTSFLIPPFNRFDLGLIRIFEQYFEIICGGPESIETVGPRISPSFLGKCLYVCSLPPAYGKASDILPWIDKVESIHENIMVPLTLHWRWELSDDFYGVKCLCKKIRGKTIRWKELCKIRGSIIP